MDMPNVQVQAPSSKATTSTSNQAAVTTISSTSTEASAGTFVEALVKVIEGQATVEQADVSTDAAAAIIAGILPSTIVDLMTNQSTDEEIKSAIQQLINALQSMDSDKLQSLMEQPELQLWMSKAEQLLNQDQSSTLKTINLQDVMALVTQPSQSKSNPVDELVVSLNRYLEILESNPSSPILRQLGSELQQLTLKLSESFPALTAVPSNLVEVNKGESAKNDKPTNVSTTNIQQAQSTSSSHNSGDMLNQHDSKNSKSQLLQRLSYTSQNVNTVVMQANVSNVAETPIVSEASSLMVDASASQQEDVTLTLTQLSDSQKLAATATEAKAPMQSVSAQEFAEEMTRFVIKNMSITQLNGISEAKISLVPEHLGQVDVRISVLNGQITAHFIAESAQARDLLELQLPQLRASLQQQGLQVDKLNVEHQSELGNSLFQEQRQQQASQQFTQNGKKNSRDYDQFGADFSSEMDQAVRINRLAYGNTFNATA